MRYYVSMNEKTQDLPRFLTVEEVARIFRLNRRTVEKMIRNGKIRAIRFGRVWRIPAEAIDELIPPRPEEQERGGGGGVLIW